MKEIHDSKCPLCDSDATFTFWDSDNIKLFDCPKHNNYYISIQAEKTIPKVFNRKEGLAKLAAETKDETQILEITLVREIFRSKKFPAPSTATNFIEAFFKHKSIIMTS